MSVVTLMGRTTRETVRPSGLLIALLLAVLAVTGGRFGPAAVAAQDATPAATPTATCTPAVGDGEIGGMDTGATPAASPVAEEAPVGTEADAATASAVGAAAENVVACYNGGDGDAFLGLVTDAFIQNILGYGNRDEAAAALSAPDGITPLGDFAVDAESVLTYEDGSLSVDVTYTQFDYQFVAARWSFVESGSDLLLNGEDLLLPEPDVDFVTIISASVAADEGATLVIDQSPSVSATDAIILHIRNSSDVDRDFGVVQLPEGTTLNEDGTLPTELADVEAIMGGGSTIVGYAPIAAGSEEDIALIGLPPGVYALVDLSDGTVLPLTVNAAGA